VIQHVSAVGLKLTVALPIPSYSAPLWPCSTTKSFMPFETACATHLPCGLKTGLDHCETAPFFFKEDFDTFGFLPSEDEV
jgi:hypothetical protein